MGKFEDLLKGYTQVKLWQYWLLPLGAWLTILFTHTAYLQASRSLRTDGKLTYRHYYLKKLDLKETTK